MINHITCFVNRILNFKKFLYKLVFYACKKTKKLSFLTKNLYFPRLCTHKRTCPRISFYQRNLKRVQELSRLKKYLANGILMTAVALMLRGIALSFNVYISNKIGAEALGLYTLLGSVYSFALTLATSGINLTTTRLISDALGEKDSAQLRRAASRCVMYALSFGILASLLLFSLAEPLGVRILKDARTVSSLRLLSLTLPLIAVSSVFNGYFTAVRRVYKNAAVQISEQLIHIAACVLLLELIFGRDMESSCIALVLGGAVSEISSFLISLILYIRDKKKHVKGALYSPPCAKITKKMLSIALPLAFSAYFRSALLSIEHILIPAGIEKSGVGRSQALIDYGTLQSMVMPVILFPSSIVYSFGGLLIPELAELKIQKNRAEIRYVASRVFHLTLVFAVGVAGIMIFLSQELGYAIYGSADAGKYILTLAPVIPIMYLDSAVDAMLKGLGEQLYSMKINIIDSVCSVFMVWLLIPRIGIYGYILMIIISELFNAGMSIARLLRVSGVKVRIFSWIIKPVFCAVASTCASDALFGLIRLDIGAQGSLALHIIICALLYALLICITGALNKEELRWMIGFFKRDSTAK